MDGPRLHLPRRGAQTLNDAAIEEVLRELDGEEARASLERDPYWPKWVSPWWKMLLLHEMGMARRIPASIVRKMAEALNAHYLRHFPARPAEMPADRDPRRHVACHCALGSMYQVLFAHGVDVDRELPWIRPWFLRYQLPDGGLNCDERAYTKLVPKSSIVSTLPPLEAVLLCTNRALTPDEERFVDAGANYLIEHRLYRSTQTGGVIDESWLELCFPRFYQYDLLRGLLWLAEWSARRRKPIPRRAIEEPVGLMRAKAKNRLVEAERVWYAAVRTLNFSGDGSWVSVEADTFPLLDRMSSPGTPNPWLTQQWVRVTELLSRGV
jgi:hypothetical protein